MSIHIVSSIKIQFCFWLSNIPVCMYVYTHTHTHTHTHTVYFIQSSVDGHLGCFYFLAIVNIAAMNVGVYNIFLEMMFSFSLDKYLKVAGWNSSYSSSLRNLCIVFHSDCTNLHSCQWFRRAPFFPHPQKHVFFFVFLIIAILTGIKWYLIVDWLEFLW